MLAAGAGWLYSATSENEYTATAKLLFQDPRLDQRLFGETVFSQNSDARRDANTNFELVNVDAVSRRTAEALGPGISRDEVRDAVRVVSEGDSDVASINAVWGSPERAAQIANTYAREYIEFRAEADRAKIEAAQELVESQYRALPPSLRDGARGRSLTDRATKLGVFAALQTGNAEIVQTATPPRSRSAPRTERNVGLAALLGALFGAGLVLVGSRIDRRVRDVETFESLIDAPLLATIPASDALAGETRRPDEIPAHEAEAFRMLHSRVRYFNVDRKLQVVLVTSDVPGEGKSTVAAGLSAAAAVAGSGSVLLVEADLRRPSIGRAFGVEGHAGLSDLLVDEALTLTDVVQRIEVPAPAGAPPAHLDLVTCGGLPPNPLAMLSSDRFRRVLHEMRAGYDLVVIDTPPASTVSDALPLMEQVDGVLVVARLHLGRRDGIRRLQGQLRQLNAPVIGYVLNALERTSTGYYAYGAYEQRGAKATAGAGDSR